MCEVFNFYINLHKVFVNFQNELFHIICQHLKICTRKFNKPTLVSVFCNIFICIKINYTYSNIIFFCIINRDIDSSSASSSIFVDLVNSNSFFFFFFILQILNIVWFLLFRIKVQVLNLMKENFLSARKYIIYIQIHANIYIKLIVFNILIIF